MFSPRLIHTVNANPVGGFAPGELLAVAPLVAARTARGDWNKYPAPGGRLYPVRDAAGNPFYPPADWTAEDFAGVTVMPPLPPPHAGD